MIYYHYTCIHRAPMIRDSGIVIPGPDGFVWFTDIEDAVGREVLGLTNNFIKCDRMEYRFRTLQDEGIEPWVSVRRRLHNKRIIEMLESAYGVMPRHWFVSGGPIRVMEAPLMTEARAVR